jgi:S1-C subfamily serine protease
MRVLIVLSIIVAGCATAPTKAVRSAVVVGNLIGHGSGAVVGADTVLTARHVAVMPGLQVETADGDPPRQVVRTVLDPNSDAALLYVDRPFDANEPPLQVSARPLRVGERIWVIGTPFDLRLRNCMLSGTVGKTGVDIEELEERGLVVTDVHAGRGYSGGPVLDARGRVRAIHVVACDNLVGELPVSEFEGDLGL